jgi:hypothetical protein
MMEKWEYLTRFLYADARSKEIKEYIKDRFEVKKPPRFTPEAMIPELDALGEDGWELVHMEPVAGVGGKGDVRFEGGSSWSNVYFGVFKRMKSRPAVPSMPQQQPQAAPPPAPPGGQNMPTLPPSPIKPLAPQPPPPPPASEE